MREALDILFYLWVTVMMVGSVGIVFSVLADLVSRRGFGGDPERRELKRKHKIERLEEKHKAKMNYARYATDAATRGYKFW